MFENAKWISSSDVESSSPIFRKEFSLNRSIQCANLSVCALGYGVVTINGKSITKDVLTTPLTKFDATVMYQTYDVKDLLLEQRNAIGVMLGNGWYNDVATTWDFEKASWRDRPKFILQLDIVYRDGGTETILSNSSWVTSKGPIVYNHVRCGEIYDARLEIPHWDCPNFEDDSWENAKICRLPGGVLKPTKIPPIRIIKKLAGKEIAPGIYDFQENISGWVNIRVKGNEGDEVNIAYGERLSDNRKSIEASNINTFNLHQLKHQGRYILRGSDTYEEWHPNFCYHGFRYVQVDTNVKEIFLQACVVHTDLHIIGEFSCSDEMLNKIHSAARNSTLYNYHSIPTDCPHREQNGWTGDALLSSEQAIMNYDMEEAYLKWLNDFKDVQRPSGQLPGIIPTSSWGYNWGSGPAWDSALILIPWYLFKYTGKITAIKQMWENMVLYMNYMTSMSEGYIVDYGLGDWCAPKTTQVCPSALTDTAYYYVNAKVMGEMALLLGEDSAYYEHLSECIRTAFRNRFMYDGKMLCDTQTAYACALYQGLLDKEEIPLAAAHLAELVEAFEYHIDCGILGTKYIFRALSDNGYADILYKMVTNPSAPSYAYWINQGMTTLCEDWEMTNSLNHHMFSEVDLWFYRYLAGICKEEHSIAIKPIFLNGLEWVKAKYMEIEVFWNKEYVDITVPYEATLYLEEKAISLCAGNHHIIR